MYGRVDGCTEVRMQGHVHACGLPAIRASHSSCNLPKKSSHASGFVPGPQAGRGGSESRGVVQK